MLNFLSNLLYLSLPKIRDFRGISRKGCDQFGNFSFGIKDDSIFPESQTDLDRLRGMDITICTSSRTKEEVLFYWKIWGCHLRWRHERILINGKKSMVENNKRKKVLNLEIVASCGRPRGYIRFFGICRICFRDLATSAMLPGVTKSSW